MRRTLAAGLVAALALGCGKKPPAAAVPDADTPPDAPAADAGPSEREKLLTTLQTKRGDAQKEAGERLAALAATDPAVLDGLVALLRDKTTAGPGKTHPTVATSTREAAAVALLRAGPKGEAALKDKGFQALREGLTDKDPAVREHTAHTLQVIGPAAKPVGAFLQRLCSDPDANVRAAAFDAVREVGVADVAGFAGLLTNDNPEIRRAAAEIVPTLTAVPADAVYPLTRALDDPDDVVRLAAAAAILAAPPTAATPTTGDKLAAAAAKSYPEAFDPDAPRQDGPEVVYWRALARIGKPAVGPVTDLLKHKHPLARAYAAYTLGRLGADAKPGVDALKKALADDFADVALEAACSLVRLGEKTDDVDRLVKAAFASPRPGVAAAAVDAVARMGPAGKPLVPDALAQLRIAAGRARYAAVGLVGALEPDEAGKQVPELAKLLTDEYPEVRRRVGAVLEALGPTAAPAAGAVGAALPGEQDDVARDQFVDALVAMGAGAKPAVAGLLPLISSPDAAVELRMKVIDAVAVADPASPDVSAALVKAAAEPDAAVRGAAAFALGKLNPLTDAARAALVKMARSDGRTEVRLAALRGLAAAGPRAKPARAELAEVAAGKLPDAALWAKVAGAAADGDVTKATGDVRAGLADKSSSVRAAAAAALQLVGPTAADVPALVKLFKEPTSGPAKAAAAAALGAIGAPAKDAVAPLVTLLTDKESAARIAAAEALGRIGPAALPAVPKLKTAVRSDPLVAPAAHKALARLGEPDDRAKP